MPSYAGAVQRWWSGKGLPSLTKVSQLVVMPMTPKNVHHLHSNMLIGCAVEADLISPDDPVQQDDVSADRDGTNHCC